MDLTQGPPAKQLLLYFLPILAGSLFQQLYTTADAVILGQFAGRTGLASIDAIHSLVKLPINFFTGLSAGATILVSQFFGAKDDSALSKAVHTGICFALCGGLILSVLGFAAAPACLKTMEVPEEIFGLSLSYVRTVFGGLVPSLLYNIEAGILRATGNSRTPFHILMIAGCSNIILDLIFIALFRMNAFGAALATVISQSLSAALALRTLMKPQAPYRLESLLKLKPDKAILRSIHRIGLPIGIQSALYPIANMMVQSSINSTGTDNIAAWALCGKLDFMIWLITDSLAIAVSTFVAQNHGARKQARIRHGVNLGLAITLGLIALLSMILFWWSVPLGRLFINPADRNIASEAGKIMNFLAPLYCLYVFGEVYSGAIRGTGETFRPMLITLLGTCATRIIWILFAVPQRTDILTILLCYPISWASTSCAFMIYYQIYKRKAFSDEAACGCR